ncbi:hypothetical protein QE152_g35212, partial [Popillia japonica]
MTESEESDTQQELSILERDDAQQEIPSIGSVERNEEE